MKWKVNKRKFIKNGVNGGKSIIMRRKEEKKKYFLKKIKEVEKKRGRDK